MTGTEYKRPLMELSGANETNHGRRRPDEDLALVRQRCRALLIERRPAAVKAMDDEVERMLPLQTMQEGHPLRGSWEQARAANDDSLSFDGGILYHLVRLAQAWATPDSRYRGSAQLAASLDAALTFYGRFVYSGCPFPNNWWAWQIGIPHCLGHLLLLAGEWMTPEQHGHYEESLRYLVQSIWPFHSSANRMSTARSMLLYGLAVSDPAVLAHGQRWTDEASATIRDPRRRDQGFREDGSYFCHGSAINLGYGRGHFHELAEYIHLFDGTGWQANDESRRNAVNLFLDLIQWTDVGGRVDPFIIDRGISAGPEVQLNDRALSAALLLLTTAVPRADELRQACRRLLDAGAAPDHWLTRQLADELLGADPPASLTGVRYFAEAEYAVARRPLYTASVKMASWRTKAYHGINRTNLKGWHISDGHLILRRSGREFADDVLPAMDWERLTGITRADGFKLPAETMGHGWFATGAQSDDGAFGCCGIDFLIRNVDRTELLARKNWFFLDHAIVATGSGIACSGPSPVETVIRHAALPRELEERDFEQGEERTQFLQGHDCIYILPQSPLVHWRTEWRTGRFSDLRANVPPKAEGRRRFWTAVIPHGPQPSDAGYTIVYLPGWTLAAAREWWEARPFELLQQDALAHRLYDRHADRTLAVVQWDQAYISPGRVPRAEGSPLETERSSQVE